MIIQQLHDHRVVLVNQVCVVTVAFAVRVFWVQSFNCCWYLLLLNFAL
uniref:Uncharacterized protein n=1 Tax=Arundo donax TaxID=35708 RepID=A0A0A9FTS9_ARUDO